MRLIWTTHDLEQAQRFSRALLENSINHNMETHANTDWSSHDYGTQTVTFWIIDEEAMERATDILHSFKMRTPAATPYAPKTPKPLAGPAKIDRPKIAPREQAATSPAFRVSNIIIMVCSIILLLQLWGAREVQKVPPSVRRMLLAVAPVQRALLFDYPKPYELLDKIAALYGYDALTKPQSLPPPGKFLWDEYVKAEATTWNGIYQPLVEAIRAWREGRHVQLLQPGVQLFERIRDGEVWRLITPVLLHSDILHLFFNMIWLLLLGTQMEARMGIMRFLGFCGIVAVASDVAQYLVSGPAFIGFSGVVCGMAFFIRARQMVAPWEAYQMSNGTFRFIVFFIGALALLSILGFVLDGWYGVLFPIAIANTAHLIGAASGWALGHSKLFCWHAIRQTR